MSRSPFRVFVGVDQTEPYQFFAVSAFFFKRMPVRVACSNVIPDELRALLGREVLSRPSPRTKYITRQMRLPPKVARFSTSGLLFYSAIFCLCPSSQRFTSLSKIIKLPIRM